MVNGRRSGEVTGGTLMERVLRQVVHPTATPDPVCWGSSPWSDGAGCGSYATYPTGLCNRHQREIIGVSPGGLPRGDEEDGDTRSGSRPPGPSDLRAELRYSA